MYTFLIAIRDSNISSIKRGDDLEITFKCKGKTYQGLILDPQKYAHLYIQIPTNIIANVVTGDDLQAIVETLNYKKRYQRWKYDNNNNLIFEIHIRAGWEKTIVPYVKRTIIKATTKIEKTEPIINEMITGKISFDRALSRLGIINIYYSYIVKLV
jgi:hypothetical protein